MGKIYKNSILYATGANDAKHIMYDNTDSGLAAATTQAALDELSTKMDNTPTSEEVEQVTIDAPADRDADILGGKYRSSDIDDLVDGAVAAAAGISSLNSSVGSINSELAMTPKSQEVSSVSVDTPTIDADMLGGKYDAEDIDELDSSLTNTKTLINNLIADNKRTPWLPSTITDLNNIRETSLYNCYGTQVANCPSEDTHFVSTMMYNYEASYGVQIAISFGGIINKRFLANNTWSAWQRLSTDDDIIYKKYNMPAFTYTAGTAGTFALANSLDCGISGYKIISATLIEQNYNLRNFAIIEVKPDDDQVAQIIYRADGSGIENYVNKVCVCYKKI